MSRIGLPKLRIRSAFNLVPHRRRKIHIASSQRMASQVRPAPAGRSAILCGLRIRLSGSSVSPSVLIPCWFKGWRCHIQHSAFIHWCCRMSGLLFGLVITVGIGRKSHMVRAHRLRQGAWLRSQIQSGLWVHSPWPHRQSCKRGLKCCGLTLRSTRTASPPVSLGVRLRPAPAQRQRDHTKPWQPGSLFTSTCQFLYSMMPFLFMVWKGGRHGVDGFPQEAVHRCHSMHGR